MGGQRSQMALPRRGDRRGVMGERAVGERAIEGGGVGGWGGGQECVRVCACVRACVRVCGIGGWGGYNPVKYVGFTALGSRV